MRRAKYAEVEIYSREEYMEKKKKEITNTLNLEPNKVFTKEETRKIIDSNPSLQNGFLDFVPQSEHSTEKIIEIFLEMEMRIEDSFHKNLGTYDGLLVCSICNEHKYHREVFNSYNKETKKSAFCCRKCRGENKMLINYLEFRDRVQDSEKEELIKLEKEVGLDYTEHVQKFNILSKKSPII